MRPSRVRVTVRVEVLEPVNGSSSFERTSTSVQVAQEALISYASRTPDAAQLLEGITEAAERAAGPATYSAIAGVVATDPAGDDA